MGEEKPIIWEKKTAWVGVFDILGFKNIIRQADRDFDRLQLTSKLADLLDVLNDDSFYADKFEFLIISDTIVIFATDNGFGNYGWFLLLCEKLITKSISVRLPLRGAISAGTAFISKSPLMVIGPSFVEAYEYCESQNWIGLLLSPSATLAVRDGGLEPLHHDFVKDKIPLKDPSLENDNLLAYRFHNGSSNYESPLLDLLNEMKHFASEDVQAKYSNTLDFIKKHYRYHKG